MRYEGGKHFLAVLPVELHAALRVAAEEARIKGVRANINRLIVVVLLDAFEKKMKPADVQAARDFVAVHMSGKKPSKAKTNTFSRGSCLRHPR